MGRDRVLVIDADLPKSLAARLRDRSRAAQSAADLHLARSVKDPEVLRGLAEHFDGAEGWVLVTGDDAMPAEHGPIIIEIGATIATVHPSYPEGIKEHHWRCDVVHRWAHAIQEQPPGTVKRYSSTGGREWTPRRRHMRQIAQHGWQPWRPEDAPPGAMEGGGAAGDFGPPERFPGF